MIDVNYALRGEITWKPSLHWPALAVAGLCSQGGYHHQGATSEQAGPHTLESMSITLFYGREFRDRTHPNKMSKIL